MVAAPATSATPGLKLGEILGDAFPKLWGVPWLTEHQRQVLSRLARCGTVGIGQMKFACGSCGATEWRPLGCQDRHCPSCGVRRTEAWAQARVEELIDAPYFHLVFTVPGELYGLFQDNQRTLYNLFFDKVNETLTAFAANPNHLGGTPAFFAVLHTTNRRLGYHPHIHVVIAGAAIDEADGAFAMCPKEDFLFPARALAASFRGRFLTGLRELVHAGVLRLVRPDTTDLADTQTLEALLSELFAKNWQVRTDAATGGVERVIRYLSRYTYRTAISNARLVSYQDDQVTYTWRDRETGRKRSRTLPLMDFVRCFARHILPKGFQRIRSFGLLSPSKRGTLLPLAQAAARHRAMLRGLSFAVHCTLAPERLRPLCCEACGTEGLRPVAVRRGKNLILLNPQARAIPPPRPSQAPRAAS